VNESSPFFMHLKFKRMKLYGEDWYKTLMCDYSEFEKAQRVLCVFNRQKLPVVFYAHISEPMNLNRARVRLARMKRRGLYDFTGLFSNFYRNESRGVFEIQMQFSLAPTKEMSEAIYPK
jgi:hypothetical protein